MTARFLVIFDLDETLIRATGNPTLDPPDFWIDAFRVRRRPGLEEMLRSVSQFAEIAVWSSASQSYVEEIVGNIVPTDIPLRFVWSRSRCTRRYDAEHMEEYWVKDLKKVKKLGYSLERIILVDDSPEKVERHYGNHIRVEPFYGAIEDRVLIMLPNFLKILSLVPNVRLVEKRDWHHSVKS
jgi:TFIIF-interacting CTD phosphatase-like protein